jgi:hypothetical protein
MTPHAPAPANGARSGSGRRFRSAGNPGLPRHPLHGTRRALVGLALLGLLAARAETLPDSPGTIPPQKSGQVDGSRKSSIPTRKGARHFEPPRLWEYSAPLLGPEVRDRDRSHAQKDPSVVFYAGRWHVFMHVGEGQGRDGVRPIPVAHWHFDTGSGRGDVGGTGREGLSPHDR